jgi:selenoprotein W-related protein
MTEVNIEYCVPCGLREYAVETQETLLDEFGRDLDGVRLQPGHGGVFRFTLMTT